MEQYPATFQKLQNQLTDFENNVAMASRAFDPTDFGSIAALTEAQLLAAVRKNSTGSILAKLCEKLDSLRADQVKALAIQNMYRCEESHTTLWFLGPNDTLIPHDQQSNFVRQRNDKLHFCQGGIGLSAAWEDRLKKIIARVEALYQYWVALCDKLDPYQLEDLEGCHIIAQHIISEQKWLRDSDGIASVSMKVLSDHHGVNGLNFVSDGGEGVASRGMAAKFTWVSFR